MTGIESWSTSAASNNAAPPDGWPEGQAPSTVNNCARQMMASTRTWYETAQFINLGYTHTYVGATQFKISGQNVTSIYAAGRRVRAVGTSTGTIYGYISVSAFSTDTTLTVVWDSGSLSNETLAVSVGILTPTSSAMPHLTDSVTFFQDNADPSKKLQFQVSSVTTATTRTLTVQDVSGTIYVSGGTDVPVADGGTGSSSAVAYAPVCGGTTSTNPFQSVASVGTLGQILISQGAAALSQFGNRGTVIASGSFPAATVLDVANIPTTYANIGIFFNGASSDTATREFQIRASTDNGSTFSSTAGDYRGTKIQDGTGSNKARATLIETATSAAAAVKTGSVVLFGYQQFTFPQFQSFANDGTIMWSNIGQLVLTGVNALRFQWDGSGNFDAGSYIVVGF